MVDQFRLMMRSCMSSGLRMVLLALGGLCLGAGLSFGAEVGGIYTESATKDLGEVAKIDFFKGLKLRGWIDVYFEGNFNDPKRSVVEANQNLSAIKSRDLTIEGRVFDVHDRSFSLSLAELEVEKVPDVGGVGFKLDLAFGDTQDIIVDTIKAASGGSSVSDFDRYVQHASLSYVAPIGRGLRLDIGKFVSHIGGETIESMKNHNYSRAFFFTYATPTLETGIRMHYDWTDALYTELYVLNGWNVTSDNNKAKTFGPSIGWTPSPQLSVTFNYLVGNEQTDNDKFFKNLRHIFDAQLTITPIEPLNFHLNLDYAWEYGALNGGTKDAQWGGITGWVRYKVTDVLEPVLRIEYYRDDDGFTTGVRQSLVGVTLTLNYKMALPGKFAALLLRPEYRFDYSNEDFFTHKRDW
jgi:hypothetical protein